MPGKNNSSSVSPSDLRTILESREKHALELAERAPSARFKQASLDEAAFFADLRKIVDEVEVARIRSRGDTCMPMCVPTELAALSATDAAIAVHHDPESLAKRGISHPSASRYREDVFAVDPIKASTGQAVNLVSVSPECRHFSKPNGCPPVEKEIRSFADSQRTPRVVVLENVPSVPADRFDEISYFPFGVC